MFSLRSVEAIETGTSLQCFTVVNSFHEQTEDFFHFFTPQEKNTYADMSLHKKSDWMLGRIALKRSLQTYIREQMHTDIEMSQIEIIPQKGEAPTFALLHVGDIFFEAHRTRVSLSHSHGVAIANCVDGHRYDSVGVDVEKIRSFSSETVRAFLSDAEYAEHLSTSFFLRDTDATLRWCLKEAYVKAMGEGLRIHPRRIEISVDVENNTHPTYIFDGEKIRVETFWTITPERYILVNTII